MEKNTKKSRPKIAVFVALIGWLACLAMIGTAIKTHDTHYGVTAIALLLALEWL